MPSDALGLRILALPSLGCSGGEEEGEEEGVELHVQASDSGRVAPLGVPLAIGMPEEAEEDRPCRARAVVAARGCRPCVRSSSRISRRPPPPRHPTPHPPPRLPQQHLPSEVAGTLRCRDGECI